MKSRVILSCLLITVALVLLGCGAAAPGGGAAPATFKVAIVMPSPITDAAFSQSMYEAVLAVQKEMGGDSKLKIVYSENQFNVPNAAAAIRDYASQGNNLVIAHGTQYGNSLQEIAKDFPEVSFAWGTATDTFSSKGLKNVFAYQADAQEGGYVQGVIAALMSKSGVLGVCGPVEAGDAKLYVDGFKKGAETTKPGIKVNVTYTGSFSDVSLMAAAAETHIKAGADILTGSSQSVVGAIGAAKDKKALWFGTQWDQVKLAPETVAASQVYDWVGAIKDMIASHNKGEKGNKTYTLNFKNGGLKIVYNDKVSVSADVKKAAETAIKDISDGKIKP
jgi:basic membrane protein A